MLVVVLENRRYEKEGTKSVARYLDFSKQNLESYYAVKIPHTVRGLRKKVENRWASRTSGGGYDRSAKEPYKW